MKVMNTKKFSPFELELKTFYLFPETEVLVDEDEIENFISLFPKIEDDEYYEVQILFRKKHKLAVKS